MPAPGTPAAVEAYVTGLQDECATDGGFFLRSGSALDVARAGNLKAMIDTGRARQGQSGRSPSSRPAAGRTVMRSGSTPAATSSRAVARDGANASSRWP